MKNIHILPTDKPSSIGYDGVKNLHFVNDFIDDYQNIYITSDEYIGLSYYLEGNLVRKGVVDDKDYWEVRKDCKKIILTTDQDLIKDGVQAIDNEFLEWFVKNPSCEEVEVSDYIKQIGWESDENGRDMILNKRFYEIIIPKGEPKQCDICKMYPRLEGTNKCESCYSVIRHFLEQAPELKEHLLPELRKKQETPSVGAENQIFKIVLDEKCRPNKVSMIETDNSSALNKQETLEEITEQIQKDCHKFVESVTNVTYQDATNTFLFMKLAELTLKLKKYEK